jgi:hypothetical protein
MRLLVLLIIACAPIASFAQNKPDTIPYGSSQSDVYDMLKDGYTTVSGWTIKEGDTLHLGKGTMPTQKFAFIYEGPNKPFINPNASNYDKTYLTNNAKIARVKNFHVYGNKKTGFTVVAVVGVGEMHNYWLEIDHALDVDELIPPAEYATKKNDKQDASKLSKADELKKWKDLLDAGAINQEEYDAQKKKILEQP